MKKEDVLIIDLTHPIHGNMPVWPGDPDTRIEKMTDCSTEGYYLNRLIIGEHTGTHVGAPRHFLENSAAMDVVAAEHLFLPAIKLDVRPWVVDSSPLLLTTELLIDWEQENGLIEAGVSVMLNTGWSDFWHQPQRYWGEEFPAISPQATSFLVCQRGVSAVGIDSPGIDGSMSRDFAAGKILAANNALHLENLTNLHRLPVRGAWIFIGALPIVGGSGSPARVVAMVPR